MIFFGEGSLRKGIQEFGLHYHSERNHQGLGNRLIVPDEDIANSGGPHPTTSTTGRDVELLPPRRIRLGEDEISAAIALPPVLPRGRSAARRDPRGPLVCRRPSKLGEILSRHAHSSPRPIFGHYGQYGTSRSACASLFPLLVH
jgi:hypothetical protein